MFNFRSVIIPEALTAFQSHEPTVPSMLAGLDELVAMLGEPIDVVIEQLELQLIAAKLGNEASLLFQSAFAMIFYYSLSRSLRNISLLQYLNKIKEVYNSNEILQRSQEEAKLILSQACDRISFVTSM